MVIKQGIHVITLPVTVIKKSCRLLSGTQSTSGIGDALRILAQAQTHTTAASHMWLAPGLPGPSLLGEASYCLLLFLPTRKLCSTVLGVGGILGSGEGRSH